MTVCASLQLASLPSLAGCSAGAGPQVVCTAAGVAASGMSLLQFSCSGWETAKMAAFSSCHFRLWDGNAVALTSWSRHEGSAARRSFAWGQPLELRKMPKDTHDPTVKLPICSLWRKTSFWNLLERAGHRMKP